jgi:hypothetical protein
MKSYLTYRLGDNDFGSCMEHAMRWLVEQYGLESVRGLTDAEVLSAMAHHMAGETMAHGVVRRYHHDPNPKHDTAWYYAYFVSAKIDRTPEGAHADGDGSYVSVDLNTAYIWRH